MFWHDCAISITSSQQSCARRLLLLRRRRKRSLGRKPGRPLRSLKSGNQPNFPSDPNFPRSRRYGTLLCSEPPLPKEPRLNPGFRWAAPMRGPIVPTTVPSTQCKVNRLRPRISVLPQHPSQRLTLRRCHRPSRSSSRSQADWEIADGDPSQKGIRQYFLRRLSLRKDKQRRFKFESLLPRRQLAKPLLQSMLDLLRYAEQIGKEALVTALDAGMGCLRGRSVGSISYLYNRHTLLFIGLTDKPFRLLRKLQSRFFRNKSFHLTEKPKRVQRARSADLVYDKVIQSCGNRYPSLSEEIRLLEYFSGLSPKIL